MGIKRQGQKRRRRQRDSHQIFSELGNSLMDQIQPNDMTVLMKPDDRLPVQRFRGERWINIQQNENVCFSHSSYLSLSLSLFKICLSVSFPLFLFGKTNEVKERAAVGTNIIIHSPWNTVCNGAFVKPFPLMSHVMLSGKGWSCVVWFYQVQSAFAELEWSQIIKWIRPVLWRVSYLSS